MGLSRTVSEIDGDFNRKSPNFPTAIVFCVPAEGVHLGIGYQRWGSKNYNDGAIGLRKKFDDIFSGVDRKHQRDERTDGQTDTGP